MTEPLWQWDELVAAAQGDADGAPSAPITGFSIDTRTPQPGDVFVALKDARDGHEFVPDAFKAGAAAAIVSKAYPRGATTARCCASPIRCARWKPSAAPRAPARNARIVAVTGSVGKTGTKEMLRLCLAPRRPDARRGEVLQQPLGRAADAGAHADRRRSTACSRSA